MPRPVPVVIALGSNLGDRRRYLRSAIRRLSPVVRVVRLSSVWESDPVDCPPGAGPFLNMVLAGVTSHSPGELLDALHAIERDIGRSRRRRNESRRIDLDLIFYGARLSGSRDPLLPHPRYREREFVMRPLRDLGLDWTVAGRRILEATGEDGTMRRVAPVY